MNEETLALVRPLLDDATFARAREEGRSLSLDEGVAFALDVLGT